MVIFNTMNKDVTHGDVSDTLGGGGSHQEVPQQVPNVDSFSRTVANTLMVAAPNEVYFRCDCPRNHVIS